MWNDPVTNTPSIVQTDFGAWGQNLPGYGEAYCSPTAMVMGLYYLCSNGFSQLAPGPYDGQTSPTSPANNLERVIAGLARTSTDQGTSTDGMQAGIATYLSACGVAPDQYTYTCSPNPDFAWLVTQIAPNVASDPDTIVLANFSVGWFQTNADAKTFTNDGGHVLAPLTTQLMSAMVTLNNPYPISFLNNIPNLPSSNPQTVLIASVPSSWTFDSWTPPQGLTSGDYSQVITPQHLGPGEATSAILWGGQAWAILPTALPTNPNYALSTWTITGTQWINTNGGIFTVIAPLAGAGGLGQSGPGTLLLTNTNALSGQNNVTNGVLASTQTSGAPFGTGTMRLIGGGTLQLSPNGVAVSATIASGSDATLMIDAGGGALELTGTGSYALTIGGYTDGTTANISRTATGTLVIAPGAGVAGLGAGGQQVLVAGTARNLPIASNSIVAPFILGQDNDAASSGKFLTYDAQEGFEAAVPLSSAKTAIAQVTGADVYQVVNTQTIAASGNAQVAALEMDGGEIDGGTATLQVGSQAAGDIAGVIMNGGTIAAGTLAFGASEALIYASSITTLDTTIASAISGSAGLTLFGPGTLTLSGDSSSTLSGPINVNTGTLVAGGTQGSATGSGAVIVDQGATLEVTGTVAGAVAVGEWGVLYLNGGTVQGNVNVATTSQNTAAPGGILQGGGTISGTATIEGIIQSGPAGGLIEFASDVTIPAAANFYWRLLELVDNETSTPGVGWNALQFDTKNSIFGSSGAPVSLYLDFSALADGDPDGGNPFWNSPHNWQVFTFMANDGSFYPAPQNFYFAAGNFSFGWYDNSWTGYFYWKPTTKKQSLAERRRLFAQARKTPPASRP